MLLGIENKKDSVMEQIIGMLILLVVIIALIAWAMVSSHRETLAETYARGYHQGVKDTINEYHTNADKE